MYLDFTIGSSMAPAGLRHRLGRFLEALNNRGVLANLHEVGAGEASYYALKVKPDDHRNPQEGGLAEEASINVGETLLQGIASTVADTIIEDLEPLILRRTLRAQNTVYTADDVEEIISAARKRFEVFESAKGGRKENVVRRLLEYVHEDQLLNIEGFVHFRLRDYVVQLEKNLTKAIEQFDLKKRQQELVHSLRQFMELQEPGIEKLHILPDLRHTFQLVDEHGSVVHDDYLDAFLWDLAEYEAVDREELLLSALITLAPVRIVCHLRQTSWRLAMLDGVFYDRMTYCGGCSRCQSHIL